MESANLHYQHHHQEQQVVDQSCSSPSFASHSSSSFYEDGTTRSAAWTPNTILNNSYFNPNINASSMIQDLGFGTSFTSLSANELQLARIKQEQSSSSDISSYPKFTAMLNSPSSSSIELDSHLLHPSSSSCSCIQNDDQQRDLLKTFSSRCQINGLHQLPAARGTFSQIFPTINISNFDQSASNSAVSSSSSLDMHNLEALELFNSLRFSRSLSSQPSQDYLGLLKSSLPYSLDNMQQQSSHRPSNSSPTNASPFHNGVPEVKRSSSFLETKAPQATPKKSRLDSRSSSPPFKVRKEKLGDRITSLQQLVAPFGKTDTASVLMEAIGYIRFHQNQVETLSAPYMKSSRNKTRKMQGGSELEDGQEEATRDLRSRGLCLVPLTCLSYVTAGCGVGVWPPAGP